VYVRVRSWGCGSLTPIHGNPVSLDEGKNINNTVSMVKRDRQTAMMYKVGKHVEHIINLTSTRQIKTGGRHWHLSDDVNAPQIYTPSQDPNLRLEEIHNEGVQLKTLIKISLVPPCKRGRGLLQQIIVGRDC
jgi:hypothetical protein